MITQVTSLISKVIVCAESGSFIRMVLKLLKFAFQFIVLFSDINTKIWRNASALMTKNLCHCHRPHWIFIFTWKYWMKYDFFRISFRIVMYSASLQSYNHFKITWFKIPYEQLLGCSHRGIKSRLEIKSPFPSPRNVQKIVTYFIRNLSMLQDLNYIWRSLK